MHRSTFLPLALVASTAAVLLGGCAGYRIGSVKPQEFEHISSLYVPTFKNETLEPRIAALVTSSVIDKLQNDGTYAVSGEDTADAVLFGTIREIDRAQLRSARFNTLRSRELRVRIFIDYVLVDGATGVTLVRDTVAGDTNVFLDPNFQLSERQAIPHAAEEAAAELVSRISEGWPGMTGRIIDPELEERRAARRARQGLDTARDLD